MNNLIFSLKEIIIVFETKLTDFYKKYMLYNFQKHIYLI
jgi:hypothetical protein